jgi:hypothetical protein
MTLAAVGSGAHLLLDPSVLEERASAALLHVAVSTCTRTELKAH